MTTAMVPANRPQWGVDRVMQVMTKFGVTMPAMVGVRGYFQDSMGQVGRNDIGIYDDAIFLCSAYAFVSFNANTDPSVRKPKIATLRPGLYWYKLGIHGLSKPKAQQYEALVQADKVTVARQDGPTETGWFGINIHKGGRVSTWSAGCQTIYPSQWPGFIELAKSEMKRAGVTRIPYILIEGQG